MSVSVWNLTYARADSRDRFGSILFARTSPASQARLFVDVSQYVAQTPVAPLFVRS